VNAQSDTNRNSSRDSEDDGPVICYKNCLFYCALSRNKNAQLQEANSAALPQTGVLGLRVQPEADLDNRQPALSGIKPEVSISDDPYRLSNWSLWPRNVKTKSMSLTFQPRASAVFSPPIISVSSPAADINYRARSIVR
jgi:hypothetical protein